MLIQDDPIKFSKRVLDPIDRVSEVLFGLIMVLTVTGSLSVAQAGRDDIRTMLVGAVGCNLAWGIIDAVLYLLGCLADKSRGLMILRAVHQATDPQQAQRIIAEALPSVVASVLQPAELDAMRQRLQQLPEAPDRVHLHANDWLGAVEIFLLVFLSIFPVVVPFLFMQNAHLALRISDGIAVLMLFLTGYVYGKCVGRRPWLMGISMLLLGSVLVALTTALGG